METTLEDTTARLARLVRDKLSGAELDEFRLERADANERFYTVRWTLRSNTGGGFIQAGTHRACLHDDGRAMLVWGHYTQDEAEAKADYEKRT